MGESRNGLYFVLRVLLYLIVGCSFASPVCLSCSVYISYSVCCCVTSVMLIPRVTSITSLVFHLSCKQTRPSKQKKKKGKNGWIGCHFFFIRDAFTLFPAFKCIQNLLLLLGFLTLNREPLVQVLFSIALFSSRTDKLNLHCISSSSSASLIWYHHFVWFDSYIEKRIACLLLLLLLLLIILLPSSFLRFTLSILLLLVVYKSAPRVERVLFFFLN